MSIANDKIVNLQDAKVLYDDLRGRIKDNSVVEVLDTPADIRSFSDAARFPMELKVGIDPVQDLHGYDHPWTGGAGKNLFGGYVEATTRSSATYDNITGTYTITTTTAGTSQATYSIDATNLIGKTLTFSITDHSETSGNVPYVCIYKNGTDFITSLGNAGLGIVRLSTYFTVESDTTSLLFLFRVNQGNPAAVGDFLKLTGVQLEIGSSQTSFEPYSNICPISGLDGANVSVTGKNLLNRSYHDGNNYTSNGLTYKVNTDGSITINGTASGGNSVYRINSRDDLVLLRKGEYVLSVSENLPTGVSVIACVRVGTADKYYFGISPTKKSVEFIPEEDGYQHVYIQISSGTTLSNYTLYPMLRYATEEDDAYAEPNNTAYHISFPSSTGTLYGGELTIHSDGSGELVVDHGVFDMGNATWTLAANNQLFRTNSPADSAEIIRGGIDGVCSCYSNAKGMTYENFIASNGTYKINDNQYSLSGKYIIVRDTSVSDAASFKTKMAGQTLTYELASPVTYQLIPGQVFALLGQNNVWADCGQLNYLEYVRDTVGEVIPNRFDGIEQDIVDTNTYEKTISEANAIQTFEDGAEWPMGMQIAVDPVQDLHGYSNPWPGGGGKNLLPTPYYTSAGTLDGITSVVNNDGSVTFSGTATATYWFNFSATGQARSFKAGSYVLSCNGGGTNPCTNNFFLMANVNVSGTNKYSAFCKTTENIAFTPEEDGYLRCYVQIESGTVVNNVTIMPMIRLATETDPTFVPYSNICPITGWTGANVMVSGKNYIDLTTLQLRQVTSQGAMRTGYAPFMLSAGTYKVTWENQSTGNNIYAINTNDYSSLAYSSTDFEFTLAEETSVMIRTTNSSIDGYDFGTVVCAESESTMLTTYHITFPTSAGTVYGGNLTVNKDGTGTLVVDRKLFDVTSKRWSALSSSNTIFYCSPGGKEVGASSIIMCNKYKFNGSNGRYNNTITGSNSTASIYIRDDNYTSVDDFESSLDGVEICYKLATPITYSLTPGQVLSLIGKNHVWADTGDILTLTYNSKQGMEFIREDTAGQIASVVNPVKEELSDAEAAMAIVVDGDTAPKNITIGKYVFVKNHSTLATGMYHATAAISSGASVTSSNTTPDDNGGFNILGSRISDVIDTSTSLSGLSNGINPIKVLTGTTVGNYTFSNNARGFAIKDGNTVVGFLTYFDGSKFITVGNNNNSTWIVAKER